MIRHNFYSLANSYLTDLSLDNQHFLINPFKDPEYSFDFEEPQKYNIIVHDCSFDSEFGDYEFSNIMKDQLDMSKKDFRIPLNVFIHFREVYVEYYKERNLF